MRQVRVATHEIDPLHFGDNIHLRIQANYRLIDLPIETMLPDGFTDQHLNRHIQITSAAGTILSATLFTTEAGDLHRESR